MMRVVAVCAVAGLLACADRPAPDSATTTNTADPPEFEPPVATNPEPPVRYPVDLFEQAVEGTVVLRLYLDELGAVVPDSTRIAEGSGHRALDSAALAAVPDMRFAPARRNGLPVATAFLQPVHFRHPSGADAEGGTR